VPRRIDPAGTLKSARNAGLHLHRGAQFTPSEAPPAHCPICEDERQYVPLRGQTWTTLPALAASHFNSYREYEPGVIGIGTQPAFAIGQRALLLRTAGGNVLWDCISLLDAATVTLVGALGGIKAIAISHPHFYTGMVEWSVRRRADPSSCRGPRLDHAARFRHPVLGRQDLGAHARRHPGSLRRAFPGRHGVALDRGAGGRGVLCSGDIAAVAPDRKWLAFMKSYPNFIPLSAGEVEGIAAALAPFQFDTIYGHYFDRVIPTGGKAVLAASVARYLAAIGGRPLA
jgi:hypothetical protein